MSYKVMINTQHYVDRPNRCSKRNWERGTVYDYMCAINNWKSTEKNLREVRWRMEMFRGTTWLMSEYDDNNSEEHFGMSDRYAAWLAKKCNTIVYLDRMCGFERQQIPSGYGYMQGYFDLESKIIELKNNGYTRIYFCELYDIRQYDRKMDKCYMEIWNGKYDYDTVVAKYEKTA